MKPLDVRSGQLWRFIPSKHIVLVMSPKSIGKKEDDILWQCMQLTRTGRLEYVQYWFAEASDWTRIA